MKSKLFLCAALAAALYVMPSYAADYSAQVVSFSQEDPDNLSIELTSSKVITDDFSFKLPSQAFSRLIMVPSGDSYEVYEKTAYEANGGGLLFRILAFEDTHYRDLNGCTIFRLLRQQALHSGSALRRAVCQRQRRIYTMQRNRDLDQEEFHFLYQRRRDG